MTPDVDQKFVEAALKAYIQPNGSLVYEGDHKFLGWHAQPDMVGEFILRGTWTAEELQWLVYWAEYGYAYWKAKQENAVLK